MDHKFSKILSWVFNGRGVKAGVNVAVSVGVRLGGIEVGVYVSVGEGVREGKGVEVDFVEKLSAS